MLLLPGSTLESPKTRILVTLCPAANCLTRTMSTARESNGIRTNAKTSTNIVILIAIEQSLVKFECIGTELLHILNRPVEIRGVS
jgi:hypothetical protein